jgi:hypothetical protein
LREGLDVNAADVPAFREVQRATQWWLRLLVLGLAALAWWAFVQQVVLGKPFGNHPVSDGLVWALWIAFAFGGPLLLFVWRMIVEVHPGELVVRYIPIYRRRIPLAEIEAHEAVTYRPLLEWGGWGLRWFPGRGWVYSVSGNRGVQLELTGGRRLLIGSARPEELDRALSASMRRA